MTRSYQYSSRIIHIRTPTYPLLRTNKTIFDSHVRTKEVQHSHLICYKRQEVKNGRSRPRSGFRNQIKMIWSLWASKRVQIVWSISISKDIWIFWINQFLVFLDAHCSGVKVFWVNACITFNSSCNTALTILCLASRPTPSNFLDTITASNLPPQPSLWSVTYQTHEVILISFSKNAALYLK